MIKVFSRYYTYKTYLKYYHNTAVGTNLIKNNNSLVPNLQLFSNWFDKRIFCFVLYYLPSGIKTFLYFIALVITY